MNLYTKIFTLLFIVLSASACTTPKPSYSYQALPNDPIIEFESDYDTHTFFSVNTKDPEKNMCDDFDSAGFILHADSIFIYDKPNTEASIQVPANQPISVRAHHLFNGAGYRSSCGPIIKSFVPESGKIYIAHMIRDGRYCAFKITEKDNPNAEVPVKTVDKCVITVTPPI